VLLNVILKQYIKNEQTNRNGVDVNLHELAKRYINWKASLTIYV